MRKRRVSSYLPLADFPPIPELVKTHIEEVKRLMPNLKRPRNEALVKYLGVSYDDFRKEVWVSPIKTCGWDHGTKISYPYFDVAEAIT